jgi:hypothetical protein
MVPGHRLRSEFSVGDGIVQILLWLVLVIVTFGLALFVLPYYFLKAPINRTLVLDPEGHVIGRLQVEVGFADILGHALLWLILTIVTLGLAYLLYWQAVMKRLMNATRVVAL